MPKNRFLVALTAFALLFAISFAGLSQFGTQASAGPIEVGQKDGATTRALIQDGSTVRKIIYVTSGVKTMANTTPVSSAPKCGVVGDLHSVQVVLNGTMSGTAPTLALQWQTSYDGGVTWVNVGTLTTINATVTPVTQRQVVSDIRNASTAVSYGDCFRFQYTFGGSGTVTANFAVTGLEK